MCELKGKNFRINLFFGESRGLAGTSKGLGPGIRGKIRGLVLVLVGDMRGQLVLVGSGSGAWSRAPGSGSHPILGQVSGLIIIQRVAGEIFKKSIVVRVQGGTDQDIFSCRKMLILRNVSDFEMWIHAGSGAWVRGCSFTVLRNVSMFDLQFIGGWQFLQACYCVGYVFDAGMSVKGPVLDPGLRVRVLGSVEFGPGSWVWRSHPIRGQGSGWMVRVQAAGVQGNGLPGKAPPLHDHPPPPFFAARFRVISL